MRSLRRVGLATALLTDEEINYIDEKIVEAMRPILIGRTLFPVADLGHPGFRLVTFYEAGDMSAAVIDMEGQQESLDRVALTPKYVTVPVLHKECRLFWRDIAARRNAGQALDTTHAANAARQVAELEDLLLLSGEHYGWPALGVKGLASIVGRQTQAGGDWDGGDPAGSNGIGYVSAAITKLENYGFYGPYKLILPPTFRQQLRIADTALQQWLFESIGDLLGGVENILVSSNLKAADDGVADSALLVQPGADNFDLILGEDSHSEPYEEKGGNIWLQVREVVAPRIKRPKAIVEITSLT